MAPGGPLSPRAALALRGSVSPRSGPLERFAVRPDAAAEAEPDQPLLRARAEHRAAAPHRSTPRARRSRRSSLLSVEGLDNYLRPGVLRRDSHVPALGLSMQDLSTPGRRSFPSLPLPQTSSQEAELHLGRADDALTPVIRSTLRVNTEDVKNQMMALAAGSRQGRVQVHNLEKHGFTTEDLSRVIYDKFKDEDLPEFLDYVELEKRGGLDRLSEIWSPEKYFWFAFLVGSVIFNTTYLIAMDWAIFRSFTADVLERFRGADLRNVTDAYSRLLETSSQTADVFKSRAVDESTRWMLLNVAALIATWEMCWILLKVAHGLYIWLVFAAGGSEYRSFNAIMYFFQKLLPQFSTFSAIKLMAGVHPSLIYNEYLFFVSGSALRATRSGQALVALYFTVKCAVCALAAVGAFTIKLLAVSAKLMNPSYSLVNRLGSVLAIMLQCMGCVIVEIVLQDRLFLFVFGGQDAMYEDIEHAYKNVYEARVARQIWKDFWSQGMRLKAVVLLATFDHYDLQKLLIERLGDSSDIELGCADHDHNLNTIDEGPDDTRRESGEDFFTDDNSACIRSDASFSSTPRRKSQEQTSRRELTISSMEEKLPKPAKSLSLVASERQRAAKPGLFHESTSESQSSASSSSIGMQVVTRYLKDEVFWRDAV